MSKLKIGILEYSGWGKDGCVQTELGLMSSILFVSQNSGRIITIHIPI